MGLFNDLLATLRLAPQPEGAPPPPEVTGDDLAAMRARVQAERAEAEALIAGASHRRDELLMQPGTDNAIRKLERDTDAAHLMLERLDRIEPELHRQFMARQEDGRAERWAEERTRLLERLGICQVAMQQWHDSFAELIALRGELDRAGFGRELDLLPWRTWEVSAPGVFAALLRSYGDRGLFMREQPQDRMINVRFLAFTVVFEGTPQMTAFQAEQEGGFAPDYARYLVDRRLAVLADTKPLPAPPPKKRRPRHTQTEAIRLAEAQTGGRRPVPQRETPEPLPYEHPTRTWTPVADGGL